MSVFEVSLTNNNNNLYSPKEGTRMHTIQNECFTNFTSNFAENAWKCYYAPQHTHSTANMHYWHWYLCFACCRIPFPECLTN